MFPCKRWLAKNEDDGAIERELVADKVIDETACKDGTFKTKELQRRNTLSSNPIISCSFRHQKKFLMLNCVVLLCYRPTISRGGLGRLALARWAGWSGVQVGRYVRC